MRKALALHVLQHVALVQDHSVKLKLAEKFAILVAGNANGVRSQHEAELHVLLEDVVAHHLSLFLWAQVQHRVQLWAPLFDLTDPVVCNAW